MGQRQTLAHPHRVTLDLVIGPFGHPDRGEELGDLRFVDRTEEPGKQTEIVTAGQKAIKRRLLERGSELLRRLRMVGPAVVAADLRGAAIGVQEPQKNSDSGCLACTVRTQETEDLALGDAERDFMDRADAAEALREPVDLDDSSHSGLTVSTRCGGVGSHGV